LNKNEIRSRWEIPDMTKINKILILAVSAIVLVALAGVASAEVTFKVDQIQRNGHYIGTPTLLSGDFHKYGYTYTFVFDGKYTISGYATNTNATPVDVWVDANSYSYGGPGHYQYVPFTIPAAGKNPGRADFSVTITSPDNNFDSWAGQVGVAGHVVNDLSGIDIVDVEDTTQHTIDQGPMSDATAIFSNGKITYKGSPLYSVS
jgi:hypothetical protein